MMQLHPAIAGAFAGVGLLIDVRRRLYSPFDISDLVQACKKQEASRAAANDLTEEWDKFLLIKDQVHKLSERDETRRAIRRLLVLVAEAADYIMNYTKTGIFSVYPIPFQSTCPTNQQEDGLFGNAYAKKIEDLKKKFTQAIAAFNESVAIETLKGVNWLGELSLRTASPPLVNTYDSSEREQRLNTLEPALNAHYRLDEEYMCLEGTRKGLLRKVSEWLHDATTPSSPATATLLPRVFWLYGMAGSGKSSVAHTIAKLVDEDKDLELSYFFCKRDDAGLSNPRKVLPTLAYLIAQCDVQVGYRKALLDLLSGRRGAAIASGSINNQFKLLFGDLLSNMAGTVHSHVIVIDALDECGTPEDQGRLAESILSLVRAAPWIKVFVTSRPEETILQALMSATDQCISSNINEEAEIDADIRLFVEARMATAPVLKNVASSFDSSKIDRLVQQAAGLFIWASTLFKYVESSRNPLRDLRRFLSGDTAQKPLKKLYNLYDTVLESVVDSDHSKDAAVLHAILGAVFVAAGNRPLSAEALSVFLRADREFEDESGATVRNWVCALHAVLYEDQSAGMRGAVRAYHPSFLDFLEKKLASGLQFSLAQVHRLMFNGCMRTMDTELKFNICQLYDALLLNKDVPDLDDRISSLISEALQYSSLFWFAHLSNSDLKHDGQAISSVSALLGTEKFAFWLEVLSLLGAVGRGCAILHECAVFMKVRMRSKMFIPR
jgi:hypothetical protein